MLGVVTLTCYYISFMRKSKAEIYAYDSLDEATSGEVFALYDRVQAENGPIDPTRFSPEDLARYSPTNPANGRNDPTLYLPKPLSEVVTSPHNIRHYLAIINKDRKSEYVVGHAVVQSPNPDHAEVWLRGLRKVKPTASLNILELGGAVVDPDHEGKKNWSILIEARLLDIAENLGGHAVCAVESSNTEIMAKVSEFGGHVVGRSHTDDDVGLNLMLFRPMSRDRLKYITGLGRKRQPVNYLSPDLLASEVDSHWVAQRDLGSPKELPL
jgi:hypothetical protein